MLYLCLTLVRRALPALLAEVMAECPRMEQATKTAGQDEADGDEDVPAHGWLD